ncbi:tyrosine-type recombinase/integrase [Hyphococcus sp.]|uniref:tyrosine-type recombinase/integrase n=1 Tax=Hyphococcus sp. TaxID=2038636 RepID=UPI003CCBF013
MKLTKVRVDAIKAAEAERLVWDSELRGFGLRISPKGRKTFFVQYRSGGRTRRAKIGVMGQVTPDQARLKARELLGEVATGNDPAEARRKRRLTPTVSQLCDRFHEEHVSARLKPATARGYQSIIRSGIKPALGAMKVSDVIRDDIISLHRKYRMRPYQGNRILSVLSKLFNLAELWGYRAEGSNPCRLVQKYKEQRKERFLSNEELSRLSKVLNEVEASGEESPFVAAVFRMLILTGCRCSEIQYLKWDYVTPTHLELPDTKTGKRSIPLPMAAKSLLDSLPRSPDNSYVFQGAIEGEAIAYLRKPWRRIRKKAELEDVRIHDLRHTYASKAIEGGMSLVMVGQLLGHTQYQTTLRYAHLADAPARRAADEVASALDAIMVANSQRGSRLRVVK